MSTQLDEYRSRLREALGVINELKSRVQSFEQARTEPIAIVGLGCRFPGGGTGPDAFWNVLERGIDAVREIPASRWPESAIPGNRPEVRWAALLDDIENFDASFFGISPREAASLDPQQRLLLETAWEALEDGGESTPRLLGSRTGVFIGLAILDYQQCIINAGMEAVDTYAFTGNLGSTAAGRLSYFLGLQGPCATIDTACSSSLVALHQACQSLRNGECEMALAGGVNAIVSPYTMAMLAQTNALAPDGRCKTFDARANGYVRGEGCGVLVLKRLSDAIRHGNRIRAVIRGSAVNQDGRSTGLTTPNVLSQQALLKQALANARIPADKVGYVELHGTGTPLGDPIEFDALKAILGAPRSSGLPCVLGALKSNVGHLEGAAGVAGIIKAILAFEHEQIPANQHFRALNPRIDMDDTPFVFPSTAQPWPRSATPRFAGVSSFGISGTNAHVILEEPPVEERKPASPGASTYLLPLSAKTPQALEAMAESYAKWFSEGPNVPLQDIAYTASIRRLHHESRLAAVAGSHEEFALQLQSSKVGQEPTNGQSPRVLFVYSGQDSPWAIQTQNLLEEPVFQAALQEIDTLGKKYADHSILEEMRKPRDVSRLGDPAITQPALFALQVGLTELFKHWGIVPNAVVGHSGGEIAAAYTSGAIALEDAVRLVISRGKIMQKATGLGKMVWVELPYEDALRAIAGLEDELAIAAIDDPSSVVLSGTKATMAAVVADFERRQIATKDLDPNHAFHGPEMAQWATELVAALGRLDGKTTTLPMYSTVTGGKIDGAALDAQYWGRNLRQTVHFASAISAAIQDETTFFLEIGPNSELIPSLRHNLAAKQAQGLTIGALERDVNERRALLSVASAYYAHGGNLDWTRIAPATGRCGSLPSYPWQRQRFWLERPKKDASLSRPVSTPIRVHGAKRSKVVFVFPGQGSQWLGMGRQLLASENAFRTALEACDAAIRAEAHFSVLEELQADEATSRLHEIDVIQPVLFSIEVALAALWRSKGIEPDCVVGHSMGEVAAAYVAGMLSLKDAAQVICRRSRLLKRIRGQGAMALVELTVKEAETAIAGFKETLSIGVSNGPRSTVLSGDTNALEKLLVTFEQKGIFCKRIKVDVASHSPQVDPLQNELLGALGDVRPMLGSLRMQSTVSAKTLVGTNLTAEYWWRNLREPVRFSEVIAELLREDHGIYIEMSPHPVLLPSIEENALSNGRRASLIASMRRNADENTCLREASNLLEAQGYPMGRQSGAWSARPLSNDSVHPLLGRRIDISNQQETVYWQQDLSIDEFPWLEGHQLNGTIVLPGSAFVESALAAAGECLGNVPVIIDDLSLLAPVVLHRDEIVKLEIALTTEENGARQFKLSSRNGGTSPGERAQWIVHATAQIRAADTTSSPGSTSLAEIRNHCSTHISPQEFAQKQATMGLVIDASFEAVIDLAYRDQDVIAQLQVPEPAFADQAFRIHPTLLDGALRAALTVQEGKAANTPHVLSGIRQIKFYGNLGRDAWAYGGRGNDPLTDEPSLTLTDGDGRVFLEACGIQTRALSGRENPIARFLLKNRWDEVPLPPSTGSNAATGQWLILSDNDGIGDALSDRLIALGGRVRCVYRQDTSNNTATTRTSVDPMNRARVAAILEETFQNENNPAGIIYLWGLERKGNHEVTDQSVEAALARGCGGLLHIVQGIERLITRFMPRLWIMARGTQWVEQAPREIRIEQATLWGLGRTIPFESAALRCTRVDLDPQSPTPEVDVLMRELLADDPEEEIVFRDNRRFVARLERPTSSAIAATEPMIVSEATYMITGGLGGLGLFSARHLVAAGARNLVLVGRHGVKTPAQEKALEGLRGAGANVEIAIADVADARQISEVFRRIDTSMPPLRGILHTAGIIDDGFLAEQTTDRFRKVFAPKVAGGWNLHRMTENRALDFFVLYSSAASILGSEGLGNYVAANAFLDALAHYRRHRGLAGTSVNWGSFAEIGMGIKAENMGGTSRRGIRGFSLDEAGAAFEFALGTPESQLGLVAIDVRQWLESHPQVASSPRFQNFANEGRTTGEADRGSSVREWLGTLAQATPRVRISMVETLVRQHIAEILRMDAARIERSQPLRALGIDSLMGMELRNRLESSLDLRLSSTLVYAHPNLASIVDHLLDRLGDKLDTLQPGKDKPAVEQAEAAEALAAPAGSGISAEDDLFALFDKTLAHVESKTRS